MVWKLLIIEPFFQWKLNKIKTENCIEIWRCPLVVLLESPRQVRFSRVYFTIFRAKVWKILVFKCILLLEIQTNYIKLGLKGKFSWAFNVFTLPIFLIFNFENPKIIRICSHLGQQHRLHTSWYKKNITWMHRDMEPNGKVLFGRNKGGKPKGSLLLISSFLIKLRKEWKSKHMLMN
jgi:hypothetical protein